MAKELTNCCSRFYRQILVTFNVIIFIVGLVITILAALLKYDKKFKELIKIDEIDQLINLSQVSAIAILFLVIGVFAMTLSLVGLLGLCCLNKFLLVVYEIIVLILFLTHGIGLLVLVFGKGSIEKEFKTAMGKLVQNLNTQTNGTQEFQDNCKLMDFLSTTFDCCGDKSFADFWQNTTVAKTCCDNKYSASTNGCTQSTIDTLTKNAINYLIIPSSVILGVELIVMCVTPLIIRDIRTLNYNSS